MATKRASGGERERYCRVRNRFSWIPRSFEGMNTGGRPSRCDRFYRVEAASYHSDV